MNVCGYEDDQEQILGSFLLTAYFWTAKLADRKTEPTVAAPKDIMNKPIPTANTIAADQSAAQNTSQNTDGTTGPRVRPVTAKLLTALLAVAVPGCLAGGVAAPFLLGPGRGFILLVGLLGLSYITFRCANGIWYGYANAKSSAAIVAAVIGAAFGAYSVSGSHLIANAVVGFCVAVVLLAFAPGTRRWCAKQVDRQQVIQKMRR